MGKFRGDCTKVLREIGVVSGDCCESCHYDAEEYAMTGEYQLGDIELPNGDWVEVCCRARTDVAVTDEELVRRLDGYDARQEMQR